MLSKSDNRFANIEEFFSEGFKLHQLGEVDAAKQIYSEVLRLQPDHFDATHLLGVIAFQEADFEEAERRCADALAINQNVAAAHSNRGLALEALGLISEAIACFEQAIRLDSGFAEAHLNLGNTLERKSCIGEALQAFNLALQAKPSYAEAHWGRGNILHALGRYEDALESFDQALAARPLFAEAHNNKGNSLRQLGRHLEALDSFTAAIGVNGDLVEAYNNRGIALRELGRLDEALHSYNIAIQLRPSYAEALNNRGIALKDLGLLDEALRSYDDAIAVDPGYAQAHNNKGNALRTQNRLDEALVSFEEALRLKPDYPEAHNNRGNTLRDLLRLELALKSYDRAIELRPEFAEAYYNRASVLQDLGWLNESLDGFDKAIELKAEFAEAFNNRGNTLHSLGRPQDALTSYDRAISINPSNASAYNNRGITLQALGQLDLAVESLSKAIAIDPSYAEAYNNRGHALLYQDCPDQALKDFDRAIELQYDYAEAHWNKALTLLLAGNFQHGWELYEWRWRHKRLGLPMPVFNAPMWTGTENLEGKTILLHGEQGLGDRIQFCRYARLVKEKGARVLLEVPQSLLELFRSLGGVDELVVASSRLPTFDYHCPLLSLPRVFKTTLESIPSSTAYLCSSPQLRDYWGTRMGTSKRLRVGLAWSGNKDNSKDAIRSLPLAEMLRALPAANDYFCLQKGVTTSDELTLRNGGVNYFGDDLDFANTAALMDLLDVVVTVDTSIAHLSGALGRPTWVILPFVPDWRWLQIRDDSPWYPTARLYRQERTRVWGPVLERVAEDLRRLAQPLFPQGSPTDPLPHASG